MKSGQTAFRVILTGPKRVVTKLNQEVVDIKHGYKQTNKQTVTSHLRGERGVGSKMTFGVPISHFSADMLGILLFPGSYLQILFILS